MDSGMVMASNGSSQELTMESKAGGGQRHFLLHIPTGYSPISPAPLIIALHGKDQTTSEFESQTQLSMMEVNQEAIVVYPRGIKKQWTGDPTAPLTSEINDIEFISDLVDHLEGNYRIDETRVYVVGFSNGGGLTSLLACNAKLSGKIAAFAIASGAFYKDSALKEPLFSRCEPSRLPIPIMEFHGNKDPVEHYDGKGTPDGETYSILEWLQGWADRNGCLKDAEKTMLYDGKVERSAWSCDGREAIVMHYCIHDFGHGWPSTRPQNDDDQRYGPTIFNATLIILDFFKKHSISLK